MILAFIGCACIIVGWVLLIIAWLYDTDQQEDE